MNNSPTFLTILISFIVAMILMIMPLPDWAREYRPEWMALALVYWKHALGFAITAYIAIRFHQRVRVYPLHQQAMFVGMILLPYMSISLWILGILGQDPKTWIYWAPIITSVLVWPWIFLVLRAVSKNSSMY